MSEVPPSPPRSATPKQLVRHDTPSRRSRSQSQDLLASGESARAAVSKLTNFAVTLVILWLSLTVDWHLGVGVLLIMLLRKLYLAAKAKVQQITGWGGFKKKERSPPLPLQQPLPQPKPVTPSPSPLHEEENSYVEEEEEGYTDGEMLDYIEEEEDEELEDEEDDYSEEHSIPYTKYK